MTLNDFTQGFHIGMHACGELYGRRQSNCREAFDFWYKKGARFFEFDIAATVDGKFVSIAHNLTPKYLNKLQITDCKEYNTFEWFLRQRLFSVTTRGLTPLSLENILSLMNEFPDIVVMLDPCLMNLVDFEVMLFEIQRLSDSLKITTNQRLLIESYTPAMQLVLSEHMPWFESIYCVHDSRYEPNLDMRIIDYLQNMGGGCVLYHIHGRTLILKLIF